MKKIVLVVGSLLVLGLFVGTAVFLYNKSQEKPVIYQTEQASIRNIIRKTVATGKIIPRKEVEVKSQVSGVVEQLFVEAGEAIEKDGLIARIRIIPNIERLNQAQSRLDRAKLNFENSRVELERLQQLFEENLIAEFEYKKYTHDFNLQNEALDAAESNLAIIKEGASKKEGHVSNLVKATLSGLILDIPVKEGTFVTETNTFNAGTTIANLANMQDIIFQGTVDESEVGKIRTGMQLLLNIGAMESEPFTADLEYIAPKGWDDQGTIKFQIRAAVKLRTDRFLRAGYSANADIVLDRVNQAVAINERLLQFSEGEAFVEVEVAEQTFEKREITTGISDGIYIEIKDGIKTDDKIKVPLASTHSSR